MADRARAAPFLVPPRAPGLSPDLLAALERVEDEGARTGVAELPPLSGLTAAQVARWLYRCWLAVQPQWSALVHLDPAWFPSAPYGRMELLLDGLAQASGGWMLLGKGWEPAFSRAQLCSLALQHDVRLLLEGSATPLPVPAPLLAWLRRLDALHIVGTDPGLLHIRESLLAHGRAHGMVLLRGPRGVGKRSLARWAHARLDDRPLVQVMSGSETSVPGGCWQLYEEVARLSARELAPLRERLESRTTRREQDSWDVDTLSRRPNHPAFQGILGESPAMRRLLARVARYAPTELPVLVRGPSGAGKELLARALHEASGRKGRYVAIDLSAQAEELVESALFGHAKGAYTGADRERIGAFREASGGTLFLDELGNMSPRVQTRLLRVLEMRAVQPLGSDRVLPVDTRVVAATNADLESMVRRGEFREDLLFRFNPSATMRIPSLSERPDDVLLLAAAFLASARGLPGLPERWISPEAAEVLVRWRWPGNVRELKHTMEAAAVESEGGLVLPEHLGELAPRRQRSVAVLLTDSEAADAPWAMEASLRQQVTALTVQVPPVADRGPDAIRNAVLSLLGGRPIRTSALTLLERRSWWGNGTELERVIGVLRQQGEGAIDKRVVLQCLPDLAVEHGTAPIIALMYPYVRPNREIGGFKAVFHEGTLLIGRASRLQDLAPALGDADPRVRERWEFLQARLGEAEPGFLCLDRVPTLSRAHVLITREGRGLVAHALPGVTLPVRARTLERKGLYPVSPGEPVDLGTAGEVALVRGDEALARVFVFAGEVALGEHAWRLEGAEVSSPTILPAEPLGASNRVWALDAREREALVGTVGSWLQQGGAFSAHLREQAVGMRGDRALARLGAYLDSGHPSQSCIRLVVFDKNTALREALRGLIARDPDGEAWLLRLPKGLREALGL